jgi:hypothetical protein
MTNKEIINRNIGLTFDLIRHIIDDPSIIENIPDHCEIEFVEKDFPITKKKYGKRSKFIKVKNNLEVV